MDAGGLVAKRAVVVAGLMALTAFLVGFMLYRSGTDWQKMEPNLGLQTPEARVLLSGPEPAVTASPTIVMPTATPTFTPVPTPTPTPRVTTKSFGFKVGARGTYETRFSLIGGSHLSLVFTIKENDIDFKFWMINPTLQSIVEQKRVRGEYRISQTIEKSGEYLLWFDNSYSMLTDKEIALSYTISEP